MQRAGRRICGWVRLFLLRRSSDRRRLLARHRWRAEVRRYDCKINDNVKDARPASRDGRYKFNCDVKVN